MAGHRGVHGPAEEVVAPAGLDGTPIELLLRDQKAVAQQGQGTVVLRRWLLPALARAGIGWATCWPCRDRVPEFGFLRPAARPSCDLLMPVRSMLPARSMLASRCSKATGFRPRVGTNSPSMPRANPGVHAFLTAKLSNLGYDK